MCAGFALPGFAAETGKSALNSADAHAQWGLIEHYCFECHNATDWAGSVAFDTMTTSTGTVATSTGCKALAMFVANVKPLLQTNCNTCHVGAAPTAGLAFDATPDAQLCANALSEINTTTPANSNMLTRPDPSANGDAAHPKKLNPFTAYQTAVTNWINAEK